MDRKAALKVLSRHLEGYRTLSYEQLTQLVGKAPETGEDGSFQLEIQVLWDSTPGGDVRVVGSVDDGGLRALFPLTDGFIVNSQGGFVDEPAQ